MFNRTDSLLGIKRDPFYFVDYVDGKSFIETKKGNRIASFWVTNQSEAGEYIRIVENIFDWISKIAGIPNLLYICIKLVITNY